MMMGFSSMRSDDVHVRKLIRIVSRHISQMDSPVSARDMARALYGLQGMSMNCPESASLMAALTKAFKIKTDKMILGSSPTGPTLGYSRGVKALSRQQLSPREISMAFYGFKRMTRENKPLLDLLEILSLQLDGLHDTDTFTAVEIASCLVGLQGIPLNSSTVRSTVRKLAKTINSSHTGDKKYILQGRTLSNAIYGFKNMSCDIIEIRELVNSIVGRIDKITSDELDFSTISSAYFGLRNMNVQDNTVRQLLRALNKSLLAKKVHGLDGYGVGTMLYGLRFMTDTSAEAREVLSWLSDQLLPGLFTNNRAIAYSFHGLSKMSSNIPEVRRILKFFNADFRNYLSLGHPCMEPSAIMLAFTGMKYKSPNDIDPMLYSCFSRAIVQSSHLESFSVSLTCRIMSCMAMLNSDHR